MNDETTEQLRARYASSLRYAGTRTISNPYRVMDDGNGWELINETGYMWMADAPRTYEDALRAAIALNTYVSPRDVREGYEYMSMTERDVKNWENNEAQAREDARVAALATSTDDLVDLLMEQDDLPW